jgi:hypothetical protein
MTMGSNGEKSDGTRTRLNKSVPMSTILRTVVIVIIQTTRTRIHDLQSGRSFVVDILVVLRRQMKIVKAVKAPDLLNNASYLLIANLYQSITFNDYINTSLRLFKHNSNSRRLYYIATAVNLRYTLTLPLQALRSRY